MGKLAKKVKTKQKTNLVYEGKSAGWRLGPSDKRT